MKTMTLERARELFIYEPETGRLLWRNSNKKRARAGAEAGALHHTGYRHVFFEGHSYYSHRLIWLLERGSWPDQQIDHIDGDPSNNRIGNLRAASNRENARNQKIRSTNKSGTMGVYWDKRSGKWCAQISIVGARRHLGHFADLSEAVAARKLAEAENGYHANHGSRA